MAKYHAYKLLVLETKAYIEFVLKRNTNESIERESELSELQKEKVGAEVAPAPN